MDLKKLLLLKLMNFQQISKLFDTFRTVLDENDLLFQKKKNTSKHILFKDLLYFTIKNLKSGQTNTVIDMKCEDITTFSPQAFHQRKIGCNPELFDNVNNSLYDLIDDHKRRYIAVDGSFFNLDKNDEEGYRLSVNKLCFTAKLSCLYDVMNECPIDMLFSKTINERALLIQQLEKVRKNDVILADRGYYSKEIISLLHSKKIHFLFRVSTSSTFTKIDSKDHCFELDLDDKIIKVRMIKYTILVDEYILLTDLFNESHENLKNLYWKRWTIETNFNTIKNRVIPKEGWLKSRKDITLDIDIKCITTYLLLISIISKIKQTDKNQKMSKISAIEMIQKRMLYLLFYCKNKKKIKKKIIDRIALYIQLIDKFVVIIKPSKPRKNTKPKSRNDR